MRPAHVRPKVVCITFDGVAVHSEQAMREAFNAACASCRLTPDPAHLATGAPIRAILRTLADAQHAILLSSEVERASTVFEETYLVHLHRQRNAGIVDAHTIELTRVFRSQVPNVAIVLVSPHLHNMEPLVGELGIASSFHAIVSAPTNRRSNGKTGAAPRAQNVYARAAAAFHRRPADCLGIARCPYHIATMCDIEMCAIGLRTDARSGELLGSVGAWRVFVSPLTMSAFALIDTFRTGPPCLGRRTRRTTAFLINNEPA